MIDSYKHIDKILPQGEFLRGFVNQSLLSKSDLKTILRNRGIFFNNNSKEKYVPFLSTILLSPNEFEFLKDRLNTREDNPKSATGTISFQSEKELINLVPENVNVKEKIDFNFTNFKLKKISSFHKESKQNDKVVLNFEIERQDLNKSWFESSNLFSGNLVIERQDDKSVKVIKEYTSPETFKVASVIENIVMNHFKKTEVISPKDTLKRIYFGDFNNETRITFFLRLSDKMNNSFFNFIDIIDVHFKADEELELPERIDWMTNKDALIFKGKGIHKDFFFKDREYHSCIKCWGMEVKFDFSYELAEGTLTVNFGFPYFERLGNKAEFEINIGSFSLRNNVPSADKKRIKKKLFNLLEKEKTKIYNNYRAYLEEKIKV
ncbi:GapS4b family protein [Aquimarina muelleri]|uniref:GapS4b family protein n=1 Tax=Aquimarina muelleri TaxID=279356 RepID=UPI003F687790